MSNISSMITLLKPNSLESNQRLAESITRSASQQTYYTIRLLADRDRVAEAYRTYAYFRWVDDQLDEGGMNKSERLQFIERQQRLIERCYRGDWPRIASEEESMLMELIRAEREERSGLGSYIHHMTAVMAFDAERREAAGIAIEVAAAKGLPWVLDPVFVNRSAPRAASCPTPCS